MASRVDNLDMLRVRARMTAILTSVVVLWVFLFSFVTLVFLDRAIAPELQQRTRLIGNVVRDNLQQTLSTGIPIQMVGGVDTYLGEIIDEFAEIRRITVETSKGEVVADLTRDEPPALLDRLEIGRRLGITGSEQRMPVLVGNEVVGQIHLVSSALFVETRLRSVLLDAAVLALAVILIGVEVTLVVGSNMILLPLRSIIALAREQAQGRFVHTIAPGGLPTLRLVARRLNGHARDLAGTRTQPVRMVVPVLTDMRLALFTFVTATEVTASFLPIYARDATRPDWLEPGLAAAAPSALYLAALAVLSPFASRLVRRFGAGQVFAAASMPAALALAGMAVTDSIAGVVLGRGAIAICYAFATIACQDFALALRGGSEGTRVSAVIMAMIFGGTFCGAAIGGILSDRYGYGAAMLLGAGLSIVAGILGYRGLGATSDAPVRESASAISTGTTLHVTFYAFLFGIVVPLNLVTAVCIWYLAPLRLAELGASPAETARVIMLFYLFQLVLGPVAAKLAVSWLGPVSTMAVGAVIAASALVAFGLGTFWLTMAMVAGVGAGFALLRGPALEFAAECAHGSPHRLTIYRVVERSVTLVGLLAAASINGNGDRDSLLNGLCALVIGGLLIFIASVAIESRSEERP
ncbi:MFS transporter [Albidovulum sediminicola]|uniref:MFS transporter n=1 Tax=Albidovulum sediminicola TaxID=2984331 RepID=A0ABT2Z702_9RHOB|nr:MFS transporter [Defluviimonas sp. WL0075]MCV2866909.1 MFS transporter [Defluviimonas sp. WL0075]